MTQNTDEYFECRTASKFIGEIQIVFSIIVFASGIITTISFSSSLESATGHDKDIALGYITFSVLTMIVAVVDIIFAFVLISATKKISLNRCLLWRGSAAATLVIFGLLTIAFLSMLKSFSVALGFLPTLIFKPFAIWLVNGFIAELRNLENFPSNDSINHHSIKPCFSLQDPKQLKRTTTVFRRESIQRPPSVIGSKITTILEEQ